MPDATSVSHTEFSRSRLSEVSMSLWIRLCNHTYIHTYTRTSRDRSGMLMPYVLSAFRTAAAEREASKGATRTRGV